MTETYAAGAFAGSDSFRVNGRLFPAASGTLGPDNLVGTADREFFVGGDGDDYLEGTGGADEMAGGLGNDRYVVDNQGDVVVEKPGEGIDEVRSLIWLYTLPDNVENGVATDDRGQGLYGNVLDNVLTGYIGWDSLTDNAGGNDRFYGGDGFDSLSVYRYENHATSNILLDGGAGMDVIGFYGARFVDTVTMLGGSGNDDIALHRGGNVTIDAGSGNDRLSLGFLGAQTTITLGSGADFISINRDYGGNIAGGSIAVTDFDTVPGGDRLDLVYYLDSVLQGWDPAINPFATQQLRLVQVGSDSVLQIDVDGNAGPAAFTDLVRFQNHVPADFTYFHLGGYHPDGSSPGGITFTGTSADDELRGSFQSDLIQGLDGHDQLFGGAGDDRIEGGEGFDSLGGQFGNDVLLGEGGKDFLIDEDDGNDLLYGGDGQDSIFVTRTGDVAASTVLLDGGADGDRLVFTSFGRGYDSATLLGGEGNDDLSAAGRGAIVLNGGAGNDHIAIDWSAGLYTAALGTGYDQLYLGGYLDRDSDLAELYDTTINVTGFTPGEIGAETDVLFFRDYLKTVLVGWDGASDPFAAGYLRLAQDGADAVLRLDRDPSSDAEGPREFIRLKNVDAGALTAYNLNALATLTIFGGESAETITAGGGDHRLDGHGGNDRLGGGAGDDILRGGDGNDMLFSGPGLDQLFGDSGNDVLLFGGTLTGADTVDGGIGTDQIALQGDYAGAEALLLGSNVVSVENIAILPGNDTRFGDPGTNFYDYEITVQDAALASGVQLVVDANRLRPGEDLTFDGSAETDGSFFIYGGGGDDRLTGGAKNDVFIFGHQGQFGSGDVVIGGGGIDQLALRGNYTITFGAGQLVGVEQIGMVSAQDTRYGALGSSYSYDLKMADANVDSVQMTVDASPLRPGESLTFDGSAEDDGSFRVFGGRDNDTIVGSQNGDVLAGNAGADSLTGGGGADVFRYAAAGDSAPGAVDHILDFTPGTDKADLSRIDADILAQGNQAFSWIGSDAFGGTAGQLRAYEQGGAWYVEGDVDGDGSADFVVILTLQGATPLSAGDFLL